MAGIVTQRDWDPFNGWHPGAPSRGGIPTSRRAVLCVFCQGKRCRMRPRACSGRTALRSIWRTVNNHRPSATCLRPGWPVVTLAMGRRRVDVNLIYVNPAPISKVWVIVFFRYYRDGIAPDEPFRSAGAGPKGRMWMMNN
ncbi:hypothetical protein Atai01_72030 [Amycolatopsis taiwanensis]|uniref:Uncharacterized protein n=1 Tax=Amycolatopsis taiwanensis TaxID=342230 RepID=A0A9W6VKG5_9PSEU|nr:hypothetical protein Atai01_72030 [Amycolatopsis taiwanensis]